MRVCLCILRVYPEGMTLMLHTHCFAKLMDLLECLQWAWKPLRDSAWKKNERGRTENLTAGAESGSSKKMLCFLFDYRFINHSPCTQQIYKISVIADQHIVKRFKFIVREGVKSNPENTLEIQTGCSTVSNSFNSCIDIVLFISECSSNPDSQFSVADGYDYVLLGPS